MEDEKAIFCLEHCRKKIFGFTIPQMCPHCHEDLNNCELSIPPFRVPSPFEDAKDNPCSVVLKPTNGDFLKDYKKADNLHMGIVDGKGVVHEFDIDGLRIDRTASWQRCLIVKDMDHTKDLTAWSQYWDFTLNVVSGQENWEKIRYDEDRNNCFSFVLAFLRALQSPTLSQYAKDRRLFCEKYILPKTAFAAKYIALYRKLLA